MFAARQRGLVTRAQLGATGLSRRAIARRAARGVLTEVFPGVFALSPVLALLAREHAALLSVGPPSVLSHRSAAELWDLLPSPDRPGPVHVTVAGRNCRRRGIRIHRSSTAPERATRDGLPVTTPHRTLLDLAATSDTHTTERALNEAHALRLTTRPALLSFLASEARKPGRARLEALLRDAPGLTRSEAERALHRLIARAGLPRPEANAQVHGYEVDALWPDHDLVVEVDGYAFHSSRGAFERDHAKTAALQALGLQVLRITYRQVRDEPEATAVRLVSLLARS